MSLTVEELNRLAALRQAAWLARPRVDALKELLAVETESAAIVMADLAEAERKSKP